MRGQRGYRAHALAGLRRRAPGCTERGSRTVPRRVSASDAGTREGTDGCARSRLGTGSRLRRASCFTLGLGSRIRRLRQRIPDPPNAPDAPRAVLTELRPQTVHLVVEVLELL